MHNYNHGRFTSPDPLMASAQRINPQTFNRYSYVTNNPLNYIDPSGMLGCPPDKPNCESTTSDFTAENPCDMGTAGCNRINVGEVTVYIGAAITATSQIVETTVTQISTQIAPRVVERLPSVSSFAGVGVRMLSAPGIILGAPATANPQECPPSSCPYGTLAQQQERANAGSTVIPATTTADPPATSRSVVVTHYTDLAGVRAITSSGGVLRACTYVTLPSEIPTGASAPQIEQRLEIIPGRGDYSITFSTPDSNLAVPSNGATTSGGV
jgi:hypothetical protein